VKALSGYVKSTKVRERCGGLEKYCEDEERFVPENERTAKPSPELEKAGRDIVDMSLA
jgi:hypothetical protein